MRNPLLSLGRSERGKPRGLETGTASVPRRRRTAYALISCILLPSVIILFLECLLRIAGYGHPSSFFIRRSIANREVFTENPRFGWLFFPPRLARTVPRLSIPAKKPPGVFRIFVLGESAAMGDPDFSFGFSRILEVLLDARFPGRAFEIHNTAMAAVNSHAVRIIAEECAKLEPDLFVVFLGNNEVIGPFGPGVVAAPVASSLSLIRLSIGLRTTRIGQAAADLLRAFKGPGGSAPETWGGMEMFMKYPVSADDPLLEKAIAHFRENLMDLCGAAASAHAAVLLCTVPVNMKDCAPFGSSLPRNMDQSSRRQWEAEVARGIRAEQKSDTAAAVRYYSGALRIGNGYADLHFRMARLLLSREPDSAGIHFQKARDLDILRFRADSRINRIIRETAEELKRENVSCFDAERAFNRDAPEGIPGRESFWEHVHLNFHGNYRFASGVMECMRIPPGVGKTGPALSEPECAGRLALTRWSRSKMAEDVSRRIERPPFVRQVTHRTDTRILADSLMSLRDSSLPDCIRRDAELFRRAITGRPGDWVLHENFGKFLLQVQGDHAAAHEQFRLASQTLPFDPITRANLGASLLSGGKFPEAEAQCREALRLLPGFAEAEFNLGSALEKQGDPVEAVKHYKNASLGRGEMAGIMCRIGSARISRGETGEAADWFRKAVVLDPENAEARNDLGVALMKKGEIVPAAECFSKAVELNPGLFGARLNLAAICAKRGDLGSAIDHYRKAIEIDPERPSVHNDLGILLARRGQMEEAADHFAEALKRRPDFSEARRNLEQALRLMKRQPGGGRTNNEQLRFKKNNSSGVNP